MSIYSPTVLPTSGRAFANALGQGVNTYLRTKRQTEEDALEAEQRQRAEAVQNATLGEQGIHLMKPGELPPTFDINVSGGPNPDAITTAAIQGQPTPTGKPLATALSRHLSIGPGYYVDRDQQAETAKRAADAQYASLLASALAKGRAEDIVDPTARSDRHAIAQSTVERNSRPPVVPPQRIDPLSPEGLAAQERLARVTASLRPAPKDTTGAGKAATPSESERRAAALYQVGENAFNTLEQSTPPSRLQAGLGRLGINEGVDQERQLINQAARQFATSYLYVVSGATASPQEVENIAQQVQDQPGDKPETTARKREARRVMMEAIRTIGGRAISTDAARPPLPPRGQSTGNVNLGDTAGKTITVNGKTFKVPE